MTNTDFLKKEVKGQSVTISLALPMQAVGSLISHALIVQFTYYVYGKWLQFNEHSKNKSSCICGASFFSHSEQQSSESLLQQ